MKTLFKKLKLLTGYSFGDIGQDFKVSKQFIHQSAGNYSLTYTNSNKHMINHMVDKKIKELENKILELKSFKEEVKAYEGGEK